MEPDTIQRINKNEVSGITATQGPDGSSEIRRQTVSDTKIVEQNDNYPLFMQKRLNYLQGRMEETRDGRAMGMVALGGLTFATLFLTLTAVATIGLGIPLAAGILATGGGLISILHLALRPSLKKMANEEREVVVQLSDYHKQKSLTLAAQANENAPVPAVLQTASLQKDFAAEAERPGKAQAPANAGIPSRLDSSRPPSPSREGI
jgi:hypothetical protein